MGIAKGSWPIDNGTPPENTGLFLLFPAGKRPNLAALKDFAQAQRSVSLTHDPSDDPTLHLEGDDHSDGSKSQSAQPDLAASLWIELLREGLTFDLVGLAPGQPCNFPVIDHRFDLTSIPTAFRSEALLLSPGQHLAGGRRSMPVVKGLIGLARDLTHHFQALDVVVWPISRSAIGRRFFESTATAWLDGGAFPALGLTAFQESMDGALQSVGLEFWIGQELRIEPPLSNDKVSATRLGVRLVNQLVLMGRIDQAERITAPDGSRLVMRPSANGKYIRVALD